MKLTDKTMRGVIDELNESGIAHDADCPWRNSLVPIEECRCNCYEFALIQAGAAKASSLLSRRGQ